MGGLHLGQWAAGWGGGGVREQEALSVSPRSEETLSKYLCSPLLPLAVPQQPGQGQPRIRERAYVRMVAKAPSPPSLQVNFPSFNFRFPFLTPTQAPGLPPAAPPQLSLPRPLPAICELTASLQGWLWVSSSASPAACPRLEKPRATWPGARSQLQRPQRRTALFARPAEFLCQLLLPSPPLQVPPSLR